MELAFLHTISLSSYQSSIKAVYFQQTAFSHYVKKHCLPTYPHPWHPPSMQGCTSSNGGKNEKLLWQGENETTPFSMSMDQSDRVAVGLQLLLK